MESGLDGSRYLQLNTVQLVVNLWLFGFVWSIIVTLYNPFFQSKLLEHWSVLWTITKDYNSCIR